jgi:hypothetical protein
MRFGNNLECPSLRGTHSWENLPYNIIVIMFLASILRKELNDWRRAWN